MKQGTNTDDTSCFCIASSIKNCIGGQIILEFVLMHFHFKQVYVNIPI